MRDLTKCDEDREVRQAATMLSAFTSLASAWLCSTKMMWQFKIPSDVI